MFVAKSIKEILNLLHVDVIAERIESVHKMIRENYKVKRYFIENYEEFKEEITKYYQHHYTQWLDVDPTMPPELAHSRAHDILENSPNPNLPKIRDILGSTNETGYSVAYKNAKSGRYGGLVGVIDAIAEGIKNEAISKYVSAVFLDCIDPLNFDKRIEFMQAYLDMFGAVLLPDEELLSVYELASDLEAVVQNHVKLINDFRKKLQ